ncbi:NADPH-dependent FMN reductase [Glycomyces salinus]|uniref:NADPH-dependent FMN reductase n=1 Tax=Glycomyces salinus TaxID=980294 RepID=UPI001E4F7FA2|nr:NAD(P)H-dependent oxidoreductase [Glycomyces salinus]
MFEKLNLAVIIGSTRAGRWGPVPAKWIAEQAVEHGRFEVDLIDLTELDMPHYLSEDDQWATPGTPSEAVSGLGGRLHHADAFVIVTPEYNHSYPASLKHAIDFYMKERAGQRDRSCGRWPIRPSPSSLAGSTAPPRRRA